VLIIFLELPPGTQTTSQNKAESGMIGHFQPKMEEKGA